jgi:hypothetical protein
MSDTSPFGFGRFVPGFDFMQNLAKGASAGMPAMPSLSGWVAPTVSVEELDKRITELKAVQFWLEQNARALTATVQALEVQRMTLSTLQGMNVAMGDIADAFGKGAQAFAAQAPAAEPAPPQAAPAAAAGEAAAAAPESAEPQREAPAAPPMVDPVQWWSALTSQFQQIAAKAMQEAPPQAAFEATRDMASGAFKTATDMAAKLATQGMPGAPKPAKKAAPRAASPRAKRSG